MRFESAIELQARVFARVFDFQPWAIAADGLAGPETLVDPSVFETGRRVARKRRSERRRTVADIALGVTDGAGSRDGAKLAILVQDRRKTRSVVVDEIRAMARDEAEVIYIGRQRPLWRQSRTDPLRIGSSISPAAQASAGTLGCFCRDTAGGPDHILSNNHVIADVNRAAAGARVIQPGGLDGGVADADVIAGLVRFVPIQFGGIPNGVDAAVAALVEPGRGADRRDIFDCAEPPAPVLTLRPADPAAAALGMTVHKTGRTTCHTTGRVRAVNVNNFVVHYTGVGSARFDGQITVEAAMEPASPFSRPGDSGSLIVDGEGRPVALLFAGSQSGGAGNLGVTGANPISVVLAQLGIVLI